jgi:hypothetical protein
MTAAGQSMFSKNVASTGSRPMYIDTVMGNLHFGDVFNMTTNAAATNQQRSPRPVAPQGRN